MMEGAFRSQERQQLPDRRAWRQRRTEMEANGERIGRYGHHSPIRWQILKALLGLFGWGLRCLGLYRRGLRNALDIRLTHLEFTFADLPAAFDGFRILQLSDLHLDALPGTTTAARALVDKVDADLCVLTGDFRFRVGGPHQQILAPLADLLAALRPRHGICAILGNHDSAAMAEAFEDLGITLLINETMSLERAGEALQLTGTDDPHYYFTQAAVDALRAAPDGFKVALVHSPELADLAADQGFQFYLSGHTHGGQVCLPGGQPILTHLDRYRALARGRWRVGAMQGYTSTGVGVSGLPVRFNCPGEVALITLRRGP